MRRLVVLILSLGSFGCTRLQLPTSIAPDRGPTALRAPFTRTWDAVIDWIGLGNFSTELLDRTSGYVALRSFVLFDADSTWADCGRDAEGSFLPTRIDMNFVVHGDSLYSTVRVNAFFGYVGPKLTIPCVTTGILEERVEHWLKDLVEVRARQPWRWRGEK